MGNVRVLVQHRTGEEAVSGQDGKMNRSVNVFSTSETYLYVDEKYSGNIFTMS